MSLHEFAKQELDLAGLLSEESDYNGLIGKAVLELVDVFSKQGHSGASAEMVPDIFGRVARYQPLTPLTFAEDEWIDQSAVSGAPLWQNRRDSRVFSKDHGKTTYRV